MTDQLAKTDMLDTNKVDPNDMSVLVVVRHNGLVRSFEGYASGVTLTEESWSGHLQRDLNVSFEGEVIERVVKE